MWSSWRKKKRKPSKRRVGVGGLYTRLWVLGPSVSALDAALLLGGRIIRTHSVWKLWHVGSPNLRTLYGPQRSGRSGFEYPSCYDYVPCAQVWQICTLTVHTRYLENSGFYHAKRGCVKQCCRYSLCAWIVPSDETSVNASLGWLHHVSTMYCLHYVMRSKSKFTSRLLLVFSFSFFMTITLHRIFWSSTVIWCRGTHDWTQKPKSIANFC